MMKFNGIGFRVNLIFVLSCASILLTLVLAVNRTNAHNVESASTVSAQIAQIRAQLVTPDPIEQSHESGHGAHHSPAADSMMSGGDSSASGVSRELLDAHLQQISTLQQEQSATLQEGRRAVLVSASLSCGIVGLLMWLLIRLQLLKPVQQLATVARRLQSSEEDVAIPHLHRNDDVGTLAGAMEELKAQRLSPDAPQQSVELSQQELEHEIQERTRIEQDRGRLQSRVHELEEATVQAQTAAASEAALEQRIKQLSESISAAGEGNLKALSKKLELEQHQDDSFGRMVRELGTLFTQVDRDFMSIVTGTDLLAESAVHLQGLGKKISGNANSNNGDAEGILSGAKNVRDVLLQISNNVEQMESGIQGISGNATQASVVAAQAVELAQNTNGTMRKLADSSVDINNVIKLITSIAEQTNLLALNATIEAARAGDAGKGFAVVANEVKELAKETNKATDEIQRRITAIRTETGHAVEAIGNINQIVSQIDGLQGDISESVLGQSSAVQTIQSLIGNASNDNLTVREVLEKMLERLHLTQASAEDIQRSSEELLTGTEGNLQITRRYTA